MLGYLKAEQALPALMAAAGDADPSVRRAVMSALVFTRPGGPGAAALLGGLDDAQWQVREQAAASIGKVRLPEAIGPLIATMNDESWQVRAKAANALGRICALPAIPALGQALSHEVSNLRKEAAAALGEIAEPDGAGVSRAGRRRSRPRRAQARALGASAAARRRCRFHAPARQSARRSMRVRPAPFCGTRTVSSCRPRGRRFDDVSTI